MFSFLFLISIITGIVSVALINHHTLEAAFASLFADGILSGILVVLLPSLLTVIVIKSFRRDVRVKYILFVAIIAALAYAFFVIIASAVYAIFGNYSLSTVIVLLGDAGIYGWWFFVNKVLLGQKKKAVPFAMIQPIFNVLVYFAASSLIFTFSAPLLVILVKLFAGILIFAVISYIILYIFDSPLKKSLGFGGIDAFSQVVQNWLFDLDLLVASPLGNATFGILTDVDAQTIVFKSENKSIKAILFAPFIHYGPVGAMGGSNFPFLLEKHAASAYKAPLFVMHCTVNEDNNPVTSSQINAVRGVMDRSIRNARKVGERGYNVSFSESEHNNASVTLLSINNIGIATFTRAPSVTEDITPESARVFRELLGENGDTTMLIDAHNSRYESATEEELLGVKPNSKYMNDYVKAIKRLGKPSHTAKKVRIGVGSIDIFNPLNNPTDLAPGNLNVIIFYFNGYKRAQIQFNANNMMPNMRPAIQKHVKRKFGIDAEVYTTDTHFVNSLERNASNVLGRQTKLNQLLPLIDKAVKEAMANVENVDVYYKKDSIKSFRIWGPDVREKAYATVTSILGLARVLVPIIVASGFIVASWIISLV